ncbi:hypothetical protein [Synechococcus sp. MIT S9451]|uniref:hypothetical protein n=1 Tax=Synechococcus sp. MIT S9451 TaxID=3082543 RepID=UPI0039B50924
MKKSKLLNIVSNGAIVAFSVLIGARVINEFLRFNDKPQGQYSYSYRDLSTGEKLRVAHESDYDINSSGKDTIILISDSFGEGAKCGNDKNIAGCLKSTSGKKVVNLSKGGTSTGFYLKQLKKYLANSRNLSPTVDGETVVISIYSNDIVLIKDNCNYFSDNLTSISLSVDKDQLSFLEERCKSILGLTKSEYAKVMNFSLPISGVLSKTIGSYSYALLRELVAQATLRLNLDTTIGRAGYIPKWGADNSPERTLTLEILKDIQSTCDLHNCNVTFATFPNVEQLTEESVVRKSLVSFSDYAMKDNLIVLDGYTPFLEKGIENACYSLSDCHSDCDGYKTYAEWLWSNIKQNQ